MKVCFFRYQAVYFPRIRPLGVRPLNDPEREPKPWGFFVFGDRYGWPARVLTNPWKSMFFHKAVRVSAGHRA